MPAAPLPAAPLPAEECYPGIPGGLVCPPGHFLGFGNKGGCRTTTCETGQYTALRGITTFNACAERCLRDASCKAFEWFPRPRGLLPSRAPCEIHRDVPVRKQRPTAGRPVRPLTTVAARGLEYADRPPGRRRLSPPSGSSHDSRVTEISEIRRAGDPLVSLWVAGNSRTYTGQAAAVGSRERFLETTLSPW